MILGIQILLIIVAIVILVPSSMLLIECLAAGKNNSNLNPADGSREAKIAVLVPAHNEGSGIAGTLETILGQLRENDRVIVVADNCTDDTASIARGLGVEVIERQNREQRGKGYALDYGIRYLEADPPDVVVVNDADCRIEPGSLDVLGNTAFYSRKPCQAIDLLAPPPNPTGKDVISSLAFFVKNQVRPSGLHNLKLPVILRGTGMALPWAAIRKAPLASGNIVEDMQLGIDLAIEGKPALFCPDAKVTGVLPVQEQTARTQRKRWEHGHLQTIIEQVPRLLKYSFLKRRLDLFFLALDLAIPPLSLLVVIWFGATVITLTGGMVIGFWIPFLITLFSGLGIFIAIITAWWRFGRDDFPVKSLAAIPLYVWQKIPLYLAFWFQREKEWIRTERDVNTPP